MTDASDDERRRRLDRVQAAKLARQRLEKAMDAGRATPPEVRAAREAEWAATRDLHAVGVEPCPRCGKVMRRDERGDRAILTCPECGYVIAGPV